MKKFRIVLAGRPNVGKSSLFNALLASREALVFNQDGITRDYIVAECTLPDGSQVELCDAAGITDSALRGSASGEEKLQHQASEKALKVVREADLILLMVDARTGVLPMDQALVQALRRQVEPRRLLLVINKTEFCEPASVQAAFFELGLGEGVLVSSAHTQGIEELKDLLLEHYLALNQEAPALEEAVASNTPKLVILGRPNVGKSSLMNRWLQRDRVLVSEVAGTTRESISEGWQLENSSYDLVDTAGIRAQGSIDSAIEAFGVKSSFQASREALLVLLVFEAPLGLTHQDLALLRSLLRQGKPTLLLANKSDLLTATERAELKEKVERRLSYAPYLPLFLVSAKTGQGSRKVWAWIQQFRSKLPLRYGTAQLNRILGAALEHRQPPLHLDTKKRSQVKFIHQVGELPLKFLLRGNQLEKLPRSYLKYLEKYLRQALGCPQIPFLLGWESTVNPYAPEGKALLAARRHEASHLQP